MFRRWFGPMGRGRGGPFHRPHGPHAHGPHGRGPGGGFGMRRPLRFLVEHLGLDDAQASELSRVIDELRLEREQAALDGRRAQGRLADLLEGDPLDVPAVEAAADGRLAAAKRERDAIVAALGRLHRALKPEQRTKLATLLRSGPFSL